MMVCGSQFRIINKVEDNLFAISNSSTHSVKPDRIYSRRAVHIQGGTRQADIRNHWGRGRMK
jgi:hypothetical protein